MLSVLRPRKLFNRLGRANYNPTKTLLGRPPKGEGLKLLDRSYNGFDRMVLDKFSFFQLTGNVFTLYSLLLASGWAISFFERKRNKKFEQELIAQAQLSDSGYRTSYLEGFLPKDSIYTKYVDAYTEELFFCLPIIFILGFGVNRSYGAVYSAKLLAASWLMGFGLKNCNFDLRYDTKEISPSITVASALVAHLIFRLGIPFSVSLLSSA